MKKQLVSGLTFLVMFSIALFQSSLSHAAINTWEGTGVIKSKNILSLIYVSTNDTYYAGTDGAGVWSKTGSSLNWVRVGPESGTTSLLDGQSQVTALYHDGSRLYAGISGSTRKGIWSIASEVSGWSFYGNGTTATCFASIRALLRVGTKMYAATEENGVIVKDDSSANWSVFGTGLESRNVRSLIYFNNNFYAAYYDGVSSVNEAGGAWSMVGTGSPADAQTLARVGTRLYVGSIGHQVYYKEDGDPVWHVAGDSALDSASLIITSIAFSGSDIFVGTSDGVFKSVGGTGPWTRLTPSLEFQFVNRVLISGSNIITAVSFVGLLQKNFSGTDAWVSFGLKEHLPDEQINTLLSFGTTTYAGTPTGVWVKDGTADWTPFGFSPLYVNSLVDVSNTFYSASFSGVSQKNEGDPTWTDYSHYNVMSFDLLVDGTTFYVATNTGVRVRALGDTDFSPLAGMTNPSYTLAKIGTKLYVGTSNQVFSKDVSSPSSPWVQVGTLTLPGLFGAPVYSLAVKDGDLYAGTGKGVWVLRLSTGSITWGEQQLAVAINKLQFHPQSGALYAATATSGVQVSTDYSSGFTPLNNNILMSEVRSLAISSTTPYPIYIGGNIRGGVFRYQTSVCGNGVIEPTDIGVEACDDGNLNNGDSCSSTCEVGPGTGSGGTPGTGGTGGSVSTGGSPGGGSGGTPGSGGAGGSGGASAGTSGVSGADGTAGTAGTDAGTPAGNPTPGGSAADSGGCSCHVVEERD